MSNRKKKTIAVFIIGLVILTIAIALLIIGITQRVQMSAEYDTAYDDWYHSWWDLHTASLNDMPDQPGFPILLILGIVLIPVGVFTTIIGAIVRFAPRPEDLYNNGEKMEQEQTGIVGLIKNLIKPQKRVCKYCGSENPQDATKCQSCGANLSSKK